MVRDFGKGGEGGHLARNRTGKVSAGISQVTGPRPIEKKTKKEKKAVYVRPMMGGVVERENARIPRDATMPAKGHGV